MSSLEMNTLSGFLQLGPHYYPQRREGAQVISRGPHGMRLAADPVRTREGKLRGSGFRFWSEQQVVAPDEQWNPKQQVVGVMGLGSLSSGSYYQHVIDIHRNYGIPFDGSVCALGSLDANKFMVVASEAFPDSESVTQGLAELRTLVEAVPHGDFAAARRVSAMLCLLREAGMQHGGGGSSATRRNEIGRLQNLLIMKSGQKRADGAPVISPSVVNAKTGDIILDQNTTIGSQISGDLSALFKSVFGFNGDPSALFKSVFGFNVDVKKALVTAVLVAGGVVFVYGLARGIGGTAVKKIGG